MHNPKLVRRLLIRLKSVQVTELERARIMVKSGRKATGLDFDQQVWDERKIDMAFSTYWNMKEENHINQQCVFLHTFLPEKDTSGLVWIDL